MKIMMGKFGFLMLFMQQKELCKLLLKSILVQVSKNRDMNYTYTKKTKQSEISLESLQKVWNEEEIVPIKFMPTGEISYVTPKIADVIRKYNGGKVKNLFFRNKNLFTITPNQV